MHRLFFGLFIVVLPVAAAAQQPAVYRGKSADQWAGQLKSEITRDRWEATHALGHLGPSSATAVEPLIGILENRGEDEYTRGGAAWALGRIGPAAESAIPLLIETLSSKHISVRRNAPRALGNFGAAAKEASEALEALLDDEDSRVKAAAAEALWKIGRDERAIKTLTEMVRRGEGAAPYHAATVLGELAPDGLDAVPVLVGALRHTDDDVARTAARSLGQIGATAIPTTAELLGDDDPRVRRRAVEALRRMGAGAVPALIGALEDASPLVRKTAARALGRLGPDAAGAASALIEAVNDPEQDVSDAAARALNEVAPVGDDRGKPPESASESPIITPICYADPAMPDWATVPAIFGQPALGNALDEHSSTIRVSFSRPKASRPGESIVPAERTADPTRAFQRALPRQSTAWIVPELSPK